MKVGDLIYHVDDWADEKPIVGIIVGFNLHDEWNPDYRVKIIFTDKNKTEWWPPKELKHVS